MIKEFYTGRTILLTGGSGFLGQGLVAKILRDLPSLRRLYVLLRSRRLPDGTVLTAQQRLESELFSRDVFDRFRREDWEGFRAAVQRVRAVDFDMSAPGLGIDAAVREELLEEVDTIIGAAATVVFDEPLDLSIQVNTLGPLQLLELAQRCRKPVVYIHVSTAYVSGKLTGEIRESPLAVDRTIAQIMAGEGGEFDPSAQVENSKEYCRRVREEAHSERRTKMFRREVRQQNHVHRLTDKRLDKLVAARRKRWIEQRLTAEGMRRARANGWNDVYTFTKAMGEQLLTRHHGDIPLVIVRPSIVESSLADPEPGWVYGLKVADPLIVGYGRGMVPDFPAPRDVVMDLVPVDIVVNTILAAGTRAEAEHVHVFHAATSGFRPLALEDMYRYVREYFQEHPLRGRQGEIPQLPEWTFPSEKRFMRRFRWRYLYPLRAQQWALDRLPERFFSSSRRRRLAVLEKRLRRVLYYTDLFGPYTRLRCRYRVDRARELYTSLPADERECFNMDVGRIDWRRYFLEIHIPGLRRHVLGEGSPRNELYEPLAGAEQEDGAPGERSARDTDSS